MAFPPSFLDELTARNPIEEVVGQYVQLKRQGSNYFGLCPFHGEKTASFSVSPSKQICYCFGCHKGGSVISFIMEIENLSYPDAVRFLAKRAGLEVPEDEQYQSRYKAQERLWHLCRDAARFFHKQLKGEQGAAARAYLARRGMDAATVARFGIGFAPDGWHALSEAMEALSYTRAELIAADLAVTWEKNGKTGTYDKFRNRIIFPLIDVRGNVLGFAGRALDNETKPKYTNTRETEVFSKRKFLFGMNLVKKSKQDKILLCEGPMDAIACHQFGFDFAVASQGTSLTEEQVNLLSKYTDQVVMTYDSDSAGQAATQRAISMLEKTGVRVRILTLKGAKDADEFLHKYGADAFQVLLQDSENQADYRLQSLQSQYDLNKDDQRIAFALQAAELISSFPNPVEREIYASKAAEAAKISMDVMTLEISKAYKKRRAVEKRREEKKSLSPAASVQPKIRGIEIKDPGAAKAEQDLLNMVMTEPALFDRTAALTGERFSVALYGRVFDALRQRHSQGLAVWLGVLEGLSAEEEAHISEILQKKNVKIDEKVFDDCVRHILKQYDKRGGDYSEAYLSKLAQQKRS